MIILSLNNDSSWTRVWNNNAKTPFSSIVVKSTLFLNVLISASEP